MRRQHSLAKSFGYAYEGIRQSFILGRNFRIQIGFVILITLLGLVVGITAQEWIDLVLIFAIVLILELINTSIETVVDIASPGISDLAKLAKDISAGAVMVASIASVVIGLIIFLPKIFG